MHERYSGASMLKFIFVDKINMQVYLIPVHVVTMSERYSLTGASMLHYNIIIMLLQHLRSYYSYLPNRSRQVLCQSTIATWLLYVVRDTKCTMSQLNSIIHIAITRTAETAYKLN